MQHPKFIITKEGHFLTRTLVTTTSAFRRSGGL